MGLGEVQHLDPPLVGEITERIVFESGEVLERGREVQVTDVTFGAVGIRWSGGSPTVSHVAAIASAQIAIRAR